MHVYLIWEEGTSKYKIGKANNVDDRKSTFQTGNSNLLKTIGVLATPDAERKEKYFQSKYRQYHHRGEWFSFPPQVMFEVMADFTVNDMDVLDTPVYKLLVDNARLRRKVDSIRKKALDSIGNLSEVWDTTLYLQDLKAKYLMDNPVNTQEDLDRFREFESEIILLGEQTGCIQSTSVV